MDARLYDDTLDPSTELLDTALLEATGVWRDDVQRQFSHPTHGFSATAWEAVAAERSRYQASVVDEYSANVNRAITYTRATPESYDRFFPLEPISGGTNLLNYLKSFLLTNTQNAKPFELVLSDEERQNIISAQPFSRSDMSKFIAGDGIIDHYTAKRISLDKMSTTKIRNDLDYMWRHRLYTDMQIVVPESARYNKEDDEERMVTVFSCHRWVLIARSPYFRDVLWASGNKSEARKSLTLSPIPKVENSNTGGLVTVPLPSPPFNPITVDYILRFLYTGALQPPNEQFSSDRATAFSIYRASLFLRIPSLKNLMVAHIVSDMMHGFFSASLSNDEFARITGGLWKNMSRSDADSEAGGEEGRGGCKCRQCSRRAPRILLFSLEPDIKDSLLERGGRRALVGLFGPGWCTQELGSLPDHLHDLILKDLQAIITPRNALSLLFAAEEAGERLGSSPTFWDKPIRWMIEVARMRIEEVICQQSRPSFYCDEWRDIVTNSSPMTKIGTLRDIEDNAKRLRWIVDAIRRGMQPQHAGPLYQTLTWFTDAQVPPKDQNKKVSEIIGKLTAELYQQMMESRPTSILSESALSLFETIDPTHHSALDALDLSSSSKSDLTSGTSSVYSRPSSRTMSTDYGIFYTRMAISQETVETATIIRRRRSWDSLSVYDEI